jgi:hypothetical protein
VDVARRTCVSCVKGGGIKGSEVGRREGREEMAFWLYGTKVKHSYAGFSYLESKKGRSVDSNLLSHAPTSIVIKRGHEPATTKKITVGVKQIGR